MRCYSGRPLPSNAVPRYQNFQNFPFIMRLRASLIAQLVKNLPAMQETLVQFLGQEDLLEMG